jgi:hypothetical protein
VNRASTSVPPGIEHRRSRAEVERALVNFRTVIRYLRDAPGLNPIACRELAARYGRQASALTRAELSQIASTASDHQHIPVGGQHSAADTVLGFAQSVVRRAEDGRLPDRVARLDALGPVEPPPLVPDVPAVRGDELVRAAGALLRRTRETGHLPASVGVDGGQVGLGSLYGALAASYQAEADGPVELVAWPRYPELGVALGNCHRLCTEDPLVRPGLSTDAAALHAQLQTWTLKSATRADALEGGR